MTYIVRDRSQDVPLIETCSSFNEAARAVGHNTPYYAALVTNSEITDLHQALNELWQSGEVTERIEWAHDGRGPSRRIEYLQKDELPKTQKLLSDWRAMTDCLFPRNYTAVRNTYALETVRKHHIDPDCSAFLTTGDTTEFVMSRVFRWTNKGHAIKVNADDVATTFSPPRGQAIVLASKFDRDYLEKYAIGHRAPQGDRLQVLAYDRYF